MAERLYSKRILMVASLSNAVNGVNTFYNHLFDVFDEANVCVDIVDIGLVERGVRQGINSNVIGNVVNIWKGHDDLKKRYKMESELFPFLGKIGAASCQGIPSFARFLAMHQLFNTNIYDAVFNNDNEFSGLSAMLLYYPFQSMIDSYEYTHNSVLFATNTNNNNAIYNNMLRMARVIRYTAGDGYYLLSQRDVDSVVMENKKKIGMLLNCEDFHQYQIPGSEKEDRVLYIGRMDNVAKNPELWFRTVGETGLPGLVIVPNNRTADVARKYANKYGIQDCEIYHSLTFDEKLKHSARCKCFFIPSKHEMFGYTLYENMNLMPVVAPDVYWSKEIQRDLPYLRIPANGQKLSELIVDSVKGYSDAQMEEQYLDVIRYRNGNREKWLNFLQNIPERRGKKKENSVKITQLLEEHGNLPDAVKATGRRCLGMEEIDVLYRHLDPSKVIQTKEGSFYGTATRKKSVATLDNFF